MVSGSNLCVSLLLGYLVLSDTHWSYLTQSIDSLHERPISSPIGMDAVIYAAQISSSFFSSLAVAVEEFLDLFIVVDSNSDNSGDDDTSLNSRSLTLGGGEKRIPSGALSAIVLWCDSELA